MLRDLGRVCRACLIVACMLTDYAQAHGLACPTTITADDDYCYVPTSDVVVFVGGYDGKRYLPTVSIYNATDNKRWFNVTAAPENRAYFGSVLFNNSIFVVGGTDGEKYRRTFWAFNLLFNNWTTDLPSFPVNVFGSSLVEAKGRIYSLGGGTQETGRNTPLEIEHAYMYNSRLGKWNRQSMLPATGFNPCALVANGSRIYYLVTGHLYRSDNGARTWTSLRPMLVSREEPACVLVKNELIFVAGGIARWSTGAEKSVEKYTISSDSWTNIMPMRESRKGFSLIVTYACRTWRKYLDFQLMACGGDDFGVEERRIYYNSCETFDSKRQFWKQRDNSSVLERPLAAFGVHKFRWPLADCNGYNSSQFPYQLHQPVKPVNMSNYLEAKKYLGFVERLKPPF